MPNSSESWTMRMLLWLHVSEPQSVQLATKCKMVFALSSWQKLERIFSLVTKTSFGDLEQDFICPWIPSPFSGSMAPSTYSLPTASTCASFLVISLPLSKPKCMSPGEPYPVWPQVQMIKPFFSATWGRRLEGVLPFLDLASGYALTWPLPLLSHTSQPPTRGHFLINKLPSRASSSGSASREPT